MINLKVSEAYALDYLAILFVKSMYGLKDSLNEWATTNCLLQAEFGVELFDLVTFSDEYHALILANKTVFEMVDKAAKDECLASDVDKANQLRYHAKKALQARFWPDKPIAEVKAPRPYER